MATSPASLTGLKGRPPLRKVPGDFDVIFVEHGRLGCEAWYRARRTTIDRWLTERGKVRLIEARAAYVAHQRAAGQWITRTTRLVETRAVERTPRLDAIRDRRKVNPVVARHAAQFLRIIRNGGFIVTQAQSGDWWVGSRRLSPAQMLDLATGKGFDGKVVVLQTDGAPPTHFDAHKAVAHPDRGDYHRDLGERYKYQSPNADLSLGSRWQDDFDDLPNLQGRSSGEVQD